MQPILEMLGVTKAYSAAGGLRALDNISLSIAKSEYVGIVGASGSGKSTLLHIMGLLDTPTAGDVFFEDQNTRDLDDTTLSRLRGRAIGFVFQSFHLLPHLSVVENVALPLFYQGVPTRERIERALSSLEEVRMTHRKGHKPSELSGGECQRTAIARALVTNPRLILADEPTGNLDSAHGMEIMAVFRSLNESGRTIALITHDQGIAAAIPRRIRLADGRIVEEST